jgi:hypothetical protein
VLSGQCHENVETKAEVAHRSVDQRLRHRTQSVLTRRPPHPSTSDRNTKTKTTNLNLAQGTKVDALRTVTSYFEKGWNAFTQKKKGSMKWIPKQIVGIGEDFHRQVDDDKVKTTLYKVQLREVWTKNFKKFPVEELDVEMTGDREGSGNPSRDEDDFEKQMCLTNESLLSCTRHQSESHHLKYRLISLRGGFWKNQFRTSRMTTSVRKTSLTIGMTTSQGTLM